MEGSILIWAFVLNGYIAAFAYMTKGKYVEHSSYAIGTSLSIAVFFAFLVAGVADPFVAMDPVPTDGPGPNPLLQNHILMVIHPPALYLGYVGMAVPFGMGVASLLAGKIGAACPLRFGVGFYCRGVFDHWNHSGRLVEAMKFLLGWLLGLGSG